MNDLLSSGEPDRSTIEAAAFILSLRARGVRDKAVLGAMERVPRDLFAPQRFRDLARTDVSLPLPCGQTMTAPAIVAAMLVALKAEGGQRALEIGTGSGYVTALLVKLGCQVHTIERYSTLVASARERFRIAELDDAITIEHADGLALPPGRARYDRILLNGASLSLPVNLTSLLAPGGRMIGAMSLEGFPRLIRIDRGADGTLKQEIGGPLRLPPLMPGQAECL